MKPSIIALLGITLFTGACAYGPPPPPPPPGPPGPVVGSVSVAVGDQPYYVHGPFYYQNGVRLVWVPGHFAVRHGRRVWIHGHYARRVY